MSVRQWLRVLLLSAFTGGVVAVATFLWLDWIRPGQVTIGPGVASDIVVVLDGAVATPGTYVLPPGSRLMTAIDAAGGLANDADTSGLYLAGRLGDGDRLTIPMRPIAQARQNPDLATPAGHSDSRLINVNTASVAELDQLPGIGPVIAQRIIDFREFHGAFESIDQLDEIDGISPGMVENIRPEVTVGD